MKILVISFGHDGPKGGASRRYSKRSKKFLKDILVEETFNYILKKNEKKNFFRLIILMI